MKDNLLTAEDLRRLVKYDPETGLFTWIVKVAHRVRIGDVAGSQMKNGYWRVCVLGTQYYAHRLAWLYMTGVWPSQEIDHKDLNKVNNRWGNLRLANSTQNKANAIRNVGATGLRGVIESEPDGFYTAKLSKKNKTIYLGYFNCPVAAHLAYVVAAAKYQGEFARIP